MKKRMARLAVLLTAVVGLVAVAAPPAHSTTTRGVVVMSVRLSLSDRLGNALPCAVGGACGNPVSFLLESTLCAEANAPGKTAPVAGTACMMTVYGTLTGLTGAATGVGTLLFRDSAGGWFSAPATVLMVGDVLTLSAGGPEGAFGATLVLFPDPEPEPTEPDPPPPPPRDGNGLASRG